MTSAPGGIRLTTLSATARDRERTVCPPRGDGRSRTSASERGSVARSCKGCDPHRPHHSPPPPPAKAAPRTPPIRPCGRSGPRGPWPPSARERRPSVSSATGGKTSWLPPRRSRYPSRKTTRRWCTTNGGRGARAPGTGVLHYKTT